MLEELKELRRQTQGAEQAYNSVKARGNINLLSFVVSWGKRALANKMNELVVLTRSQGELLECRIMCFDETLSHVEQGAKLDQWRQRQPGLKRHIYLQ